MKHQSCKFTAVVFFSFTLLLSGCKLEMEPYPTDDIVVSESGLGVISGKVVSPNGKAIGNATVEVVGNEKYNTKTDTEGDFSFEVPSGEQKLRIFTGSGEVFGSSKNVLVLSEKTVSLEPIPLDLFPSSKLAYVQGDYDHIESIITNTLGYEVALLEHAELENLDNLKKYDVVFFNCGYSGLSGDSASSQVQMDNIRKNIGNYVKGGGKIYASDYAFGYIAPQCETGYGNIFESNNIIIGKDEMCLAMNGNEQTITGDVADEDLANIIGEKAEIVFDLGGWAMVHPTPSFKGNVLVEGDNSAVLAFSQKIGEGQLLYTTFHNEANISEDMEAILEFFIHNF